MGGDDRRHHSLAGEVDPRGRCGCCNLAAAADACDGAALDQNCGILECSTAVAGDQARPSNRTVCALAGCATAAAASAARPNQAAVSWDIGISPFASQ